jgi:ribonucleoside-diphosphate reductase alpha chain
MMNVLAANKCVISTTAAPKRPQDMAGELHHFVIDGRKYYVAVGLFGDENQPYEVFTGVNETRKEIYIPKTVKTGVIKKQGRGNYHFVHEGEVYELTNGHSNDTAAALTRIISTALRHGTDIAFIVHQLEKTEGPITCFSKALARTLKKYIKDGTSISGEECPECKGKMVRKEGCASCPQCGHSKCG